MYVSNSLFHFDTLVSVKLISLQLSISKPYPVVEILCLPSLEQPQNGSVSCTSGNKFGSDCHFSCDVGYFLSGQDLVRCADEDGDGVGDWSAGPPVCESVYTLMTTVK